MSQTQKHTNTLTKPVITKSSIEQETKERLTRIDKEFSDGFEIVNAHSNTVTIFGSARFTDDNEHYRKAQEVGRALSKEGYTIVTGGGGGIMEAGNRGAFEANGPSIGFNITLPHEQVLNPYTTDSMPFHYFFTRKVILAYGAGAYVFFPGGFGTMDELFEILTLVQTKKIPSAPVILVGKSFWNDLDAFIGKQLLDGVHAISQGDDKLYTITDDVNLVVELVNNARPDFA